MSQWCRMPIGIFIGEEELKSVMNKYRKELLEYTREDVVRGITTLHFMGDKSCCEYFVRPESVLYGFLRREGKADVYMIGIDD